MTTLPNHPKNQNTYTTDADYRSEFSNITKLHTYPHGNYINDYNTIYSNEQYVPLSANDLNEAQLNAQERNEIQNQNPNYEHLEQRNFLDPREQQQINFLALREQQQLDYLRSQEQQRPEVDQYKQNQYTDEVKNVYENFAPHQPPSYLHSENSERGNDYVINTPYTTSPAAKKNKNLLARFCGQLFGIFLIIFMLLLSFLLIRSFQAGITASYIARHNQNEWRKHDK